LSRNGMIFDEWKNREIHKGKFFITDGVIDIDRWEQSSFKILFILKEAYSGTPDSEGEWDLASYLNQGLHALRGKMWKTVSQWCLGIQKLVISGEVCIFDESYKGNMEFDDALRGCAVINLKKSSGYSSSNNADLRQYVESDWDLIEAQIDELKPDLIVCGSTWPLIKSKIPHEKCGEWLYKSDRHYFVDFWHPANQYPNKLNYYSLLTALKLSIQEWRPET
ncbi:TPA: hypothetical protein ACGUW3_004509, partial [Vibrio vulnificus]